MQQGNPAPPGVIAFPADVKRFPRVNRPEWQIRYPNFHPTGDITSKLYWSGNEASKRWKAAIDGPAAELSDAGVDSTDFIVAVFDKVAEMYVSADRRLENASCPAHAVTRSLTGAGMNLCSNGCSNAPLLARKGG